jgi:hypothetical protein
MKIHSGDILFVAYVYMYTHIVIMCTQSLSLSLSPSPPFLSLLSSIHTTQYYAQSYSKLEDLQPGSGELMRFTFLLISAVDYNYYQDSHKVVARVEGFSRLSLNKREFPPVKLVLEGKIFVLMNNVRTT